MAGNPPQQYAPLFDEEYKISFNGTYADHLKYEPKQLCGVDLVINYSKDTFKKPVYSPCDGYARMLTDGTGAHYVVIAETNSLFQHFLVHLESFQGSERFVKKGENVGFAGNSGYVIPSPPPEWAGCHVHYMIYQNGIDIDPTPFINFDIIPIVIKRNEMNSIQFKDQTFVTAIFDDGTRVSVLDENGNTIGKIYYDSLLIKEGEDITSQVQGNAIIQYTVSDKDLLIKRRFTPGKNGGWSGWQDISFKFN